MTAHAYTHKRGGNDPIKLDDLAEPDDNVDLNVNTLRHGLMTKLSGNSSEAYRGDGSWGVVSGGGGSFIPMVDGGEPPAFITDGAGVLILVAYP